MNKKIPQNVIDAAKLVGMYFALRNVDEWELGPCGPRRQLNALRARVAELEAKIRDAPVAAWQWQDVNGQWHYPFSEKHLKDTAEAGYPTRGLIARPEITP